MKLLSDFMGNFSSLFLCNFFLHFFFRFLLKTIFQHFICYVYIHTLGYMYILLWKPFQIFYLCLLTFRFSFVDVQNYVNKYSIMVYKSTYGCLCYSFMKNQQNINPCRHFSFHKNVYFLYFMAFCYYISNALFYFFFAFQFYFLNNWCWNLNSRSFLYF